LTLKGKYEKISNYNLSYENLLEAISEFEGFVTGLSHNDESVFLSKFDAAGLGFKESFSGIKDFKNPISEKELDIFLKRIASRILDRTTGGYFMYDMFDGGMHDMFFKTLSDHSALMETSQLLVAGLIKGDGIGKYMQIFLPSKDGSEIKKNKNNAFVKCFPRSGEHMNEIIKWYNTKNVLKADQTNTGGQRILDKNGDFKQRWTTNASDQGDIQYPQINSNPRQPSRFTRPNLGAIVMRHPRVSIAGRNKSHLPIFFNAIPPVEMSRCAPYVTLQVITQDFGTDSKKIANINQVKYFRFVKNGKTFDSFFDDANQFASSKPVNKSSTLSEIKDKRKDTTQYSFMDMFNAPQTMANADINKNNIDFFKISKNNSDPVLDPIMPMMSLNSVNINITGAGFGIMSSKKGSLSLTLHDRSRMRDIAPLISSDQFATTKIIIEYGWNHPEGGINSDNIIGKYLNGLKERSVFQVVGTSYSFSDGNSVKIDIDLAAYGYRQNERIHCGSGPEVPINILEDLIKKATNDIVKDKDSNGNFINAPEVRQKVKLNSRNARSIDTAISWSQYDVISKLLREDAGKNRLIGSFKNLLKPGSSDDDIDLSIDDGINSSEIETENQVKRMIGKLNDIKDRNSSDPFKGSIVTGADVLSLTTEDGQPLYLKSQENSVSLGKVISHFIGHPMASSCMYDEVQLYFYPLNHQAAGARIHTTASFPISINKLNDAIDAQLNINPTITVNSFFRLLEKLVRDRNNEAYGLSEIYTPLNELNAQDESLVLLALKSQINASDAERLGLEASDIPHLPKILSANSIDDILSESDKEDLKQLREDRNSILIEIDDIEKKISSLKAQNKALEEKNVKLLEAQEKSEESQNKSIDDSTLSLEEAAELANSAAAKGKSIASERASNKSQIDKNLVFIDVNEADITRIQSDGRVASINTNIARIEGPYKTYQKLLSAQKEEISKYIKESVTGKCATIYKNDGLQGIYPAEPTFTRPNIAMDFEVVDVIQPPSSLSNTILGGMFNDLKNVIKDEQDTVNGLKEDKTILKIHIYDEEATIDPAKSAVYNSMIGDNPDSERKTITGRLLDTVNSLNFNDIKAMMKRSYPTIIYGAAGSTVKKLSVSANTSGDLSNVLMVEAYERLQDGQVSGNSYESEFESIVTLPNTVSLTMMGMPMIGRGNNVFIDFGTSTSLDNIYTVKQVSHSLVAGDFTTTVQLVPTNFASISSFKDRMQKVAKAL